MNTAVVMHIYFPHCQKIKYLRFTPQYMIEPTLVYKQIITCYSCQWRVCLETFKHSI